MAAKIIEGSFNFKESEEEAQLQRDAAGPNIWPIYNTIKNTSQDTLIHLMPLAGLGNLQSVRSLLKQNNVDNVDIYGVFIAHAMLTGLQTIHNKNIYHCDLKLSNVIANLKGEVGITDFGRSIKSPAPQIAARSSDYRYQSPERATSEFFRADLDDAWAAGISLLEFMYGSSLSELFPFLASIPQFRTKATSLENYKATFQTHLDQIAELKKPSADSIWWLIKNLLQIDPNKRWLPKRALIAPCFANLNSAIRDSLFLNLVQDVPAEFIQEQQSHEQAQATKVPTQDTYFTYFYDHKKEEVFYL